jgi:predicted nucleic-acid-binding Zn-ribbon protein
VKNETQNVKIVQKCPVCGGTYFNHLTIFATKEEIESGNYEALECRKCGERGSDEHFVMEVKDEKR